MDAKTIDLLTSLLPSSNGGSNSGIPGRRSASRFVEKYTNLAFGWYCASAFAKARVKFPVIMTGSDRWVFKAYLHLADPDNFYNPHIDEAEAIATDDYGTMEMTATD